MFVYALDTPLSRANLSTDLLEQSKIYGTSMLKLAIVLVPRLRSSVPDSGNLLLLEY